MSKQSHPTVHLGSVSPWREAFDSYYGHDDASVSSQPEYDIPADWQPGDLLVVITQARVPTVVHIHTLVHGSHSPDQFLTQDYSDKYWTGVSLPAVELRLGTSLPEAPATLDSSLGRRLLHAIEAEDRHPTPWYVTDDSECTQSPPDLRRQMRDNSPGPRTCSCCARDMRPHPLHAAARGIGWHQPQPQEGDDDVPLNTDPSPVCETCHAILHAPFGPSPMELLYSFRPACPSCGERAANLIMRGMPAGPPPPGTVLFGCCLSGDASDYTVFICAACGHEWGDDSHELDPFEDEDYEDE